MKRKRLLIGLLLGVLIVALGPLAVSLLGLRGAVAQALERQWGRPVELRRVSARLLPEPALHATGVRIGEAETFGAEPFVQAEEIHCRLKLFPLLRGRIECSRLHLVRPSLNLVRNPHGAWNIAQWAQRAAVTWPELSAEEARINFKEGAEKKIYALSNAQFILEARPDTWQVSLAAQPFRPDRRLTEAGRVHLRGTLGRAPDRTGTVPVDLSWEIERGALSQWIAFVSGREFALRADLRLQGRIAKTEEGFLLTGDFILEDLHRWDLIPGRPVPRWQGQYEIKGSGSRLSLEIARAELRTERSAVEARGRIDDVLGKPRWEVEVTAPRLELDELLAQYGALKANVSRRARLEGGARLTAKLFGPWLRWKATLALPQPARLRLPGIREAVRIEPVEIRWQQGRFVSGPVRLVFPGARSVEVSGRVVPQGLAWYARITTHTPGMELAYLVTAARALGWNLWGESDWRGAAQAVLEWRGDLRAARDLRCWGSVELRDVMFQPTSANQPFHIETARVEYTGRGVRVMPLTVHVAQVTVNGTLERTQPGSPWRIDLRADRIALDKLDALLNPARARGLLGTFMGSPHRPTATWEEVQAQGRVAAETLAVGPFLLSQLQADLEWKQRRLRLAQLRFRSLGGQFRGRLEADFRVSPPAYRMAGNLKQIDLNQFLRAGTGLGEFFSGTGGADVLLETAGHSSPEVRRNLEGTVAGVVTDATLTNVNLLGAMRAAAGMDPEESDAQPRTALQSLAGEFRLANRRVNCAGLRMVVNAAALEASGEVDFEGRLNLRLRGEPLWVADIEPTPRLRQLFTSRFEIRGDLRAPVVRVVPRIPRR